ncbi:unnamed protein product [Trichobilharzia szidati]|nr:unnamed protein product [Trichobilharzia szidati]
MPRQLNFYQHSNNMPSSANVRPKDSPVKVIDRAQYLNFPSHGQTVQGNHVMSTYPGGYDNSNHMNKIDNKYLTNLPNSTMCSDNFGHQSRVLNQYQHQPQPQPQTVQKCYASPMNYDQSMTTASTSVGKVQLTNQSVTIGNTPNHHSLPSSMGQQSSHPCYLAGSTFQERPAHQVTNHQMSFPPSQPPPAPPPPPPPPPHHQHHPQQLRPQELQYPSQAFNPGNVGMRHPSTIERNSSVNPLSSPTMSPLNTAYLQDTRRYLSGSGSLSEKRNHHHSQLQQLQTSASPLHSSLQTRSKTSSIPYTGDANFGYPPSLNSSSLHNSNNNNSNIQQYPSRNHPFVPPISYRPATLTTNVNFVSSAQQYNQPTTTTTGITVATTMTPATTTDPTSTASNKSCVVNRRERSSKDPSELNQAQQYPTAYSSQNNLSSMQSKAEMNVTNIPASNPVLHKYAPYTPSSQMQNNQLPMVPQPSEQPSFLESSFILQLSTASFFYNTEQRRKARELYVALKQRYPSASQSTPTQDEVPLLSSTQNTPPVNRDNPQEQSQQPPNKPQEQHSDNGLSVKDPVVSQNNQLKHNETDRNHSEASILSSSDTTQKYDSKNTLEDQSQSNIPKDFSSSDRKANSSLISNAATTTTTTTTTTNSASSILLTDSKSQHSANLVETIKNLSYQAVSPDDLIRGPCGYQSDGGLECMSIFSPPTNSSYDSMKQLTSPISYQTTSKSTTTTSTTNQQQQQQIDINDKLYNPSNVLISSLPRNLKAPYLNSSLQFINYQTKKKKSDDENNENLGNYARRMHERLQEGMRAAQESLWIPDLPELNIMNRLNHSDIMKNISSSMNEGNKTTSLSESETDHLQCSNQNDESKVKIAAMTTMVNPNINLDKVSSPLSISDTGHLPHQLNSRVNCYSSLNLGFHLSNTSVGGGGGNRSQQDASQAILKGFNSQSINNMKVNNNNNSSNSDNANDIHSDYSHWDLKNGVCSDVEDLLNQHERRLLSLSSGTGKIRFLLCCMLVFGSYEKLHRIQR